MSPLRTREQLVNGWFWLCHYRDLCSSSPGEATPPPGLVFHHVPLSTKNRCTMLELQVVSFGDKRRTAAWETEPQMALRHCSKEVVVVVAVQLLSHVQHFATPWTARHTRLPCPSLSPWVCSNSCPLSWWCYPTISSSVDPFSPCPQSFPESGSFPMSQLFASGSQSTGASVSAPVLPMNIQGWFPFGLTGSISLLTKGLLRVLFSTTVWKHQCFSTQPSYGPTLRSIHDYQKNHTFDSVDLEVVGVGQYMWFWWRGCEMKSSTYFTKVFFLLVSRNRCHHEGI